MIDFPIVKCLCWNMVIVVVLMYMIRYNTIQYNTMLSYAECLVFGLHCVKHLAVKVTEAGRNSAMGESSRKAASVRVR